MTDREFGAGLSAPRVPRRRPAPSAAAGKSPLLLAVAVAALLVAAVAQAALPRAVTRTFLDNGIPLNAVAVVVQDVDQRRPLFALQPRRPMNPASVMKLVTTFAALDTLGPDYRWRTEAYVDGTLEQGVLTGNLVLKGYGDPKITIEQWQALMAGLRRAGIDRIDGDLVLDRSYFDLAPYDAGAFDGAPQRAYNVGPDALLVNFKAVRFSFAPNATSDGTVVDIQPPLDPIHVEAPPALASGPCDDDWGETIAPVFQDSGDAAEVSFPGRYPASCGERSFNVALLAPGPYVHAMFTTYFRAAGGTFKGGWRAGTAPANASPVAVLQSPPLYEVVRDVNKFSNNVMARQLFLTLATTAYPPPATLAHAAAAVRRWLRARRLAMPELVLENGAGLSRVERISAGSLARLLVTADRSRLGEDFVTSLAVAGTDGTVRKRLRDGGAAGQALLKTGTLDGVRAVAGYVLDRSGRRWAVVAIINHPSASRGQPALDFLVEWVYRYASAFAHASH